MLATSGTVWRGHTDREEVIRLEQDLLELNQVGML